MQVILLQRIGRLGQMGDIVNVKDGYARNFLLPQKKALRATEDNKKVFEGKRAQLEANNLSLKKEAEAVHAKLEGQTFALIRAAGDTGQLYGSVSTRDIAAVISEGGYTVDRNQVILDKPIGMTSTQAVAVVKRLFNARRAGHAGTLDPLASGGLPIALGEATKTVSFAVDGAKAYRFSVRWGAETPTDDAESAPSATSDLRPTLDAIEAILPRFVGVISQVPPAFSAIKIDGNRAYDLARDGESVTLEPRNVVIDSLRVVDMPADDTTVFEADCGKGTYVRAVARDLGRLLGCFGHVVALRRTRVGTFTEEMSVTLDELRADADSGEIRHDLLPVETALGDIMALDVSPSDAASLCRGQAVLIRGRDAPVLHGVAYALSRGRLVALGPEAPELCDLCCAHR